MKTLIYGEDVQGEMVSIEQARQFRPPAELRFEVTEPIRMEANSLRLRGFLVNPTKKAISVIVFPVNGQDPFHMEFVADKKIKPKPNGGPPIPPVPPPPMEIQIPAMAKVSFETGLRLDEYEYEGSPEVNVRWMYHYWNDPKPSGIISLRLPKGGRHD